METVDVTFQPFTSPFSLSPFSLSQSSLTEFFGRMWEENAEPPQRLTRLVYTDGNGRVKKKYGAAFCVR